MNSTKGIEREKLVLDRINKLRNDNREFSLEVAKVEINNFLNKSKLAEEKNIGDNNDGE